MRRRLFTLASLISAVMWVGVETLLVRGYWVTDQFHREWVENEGDRSYWWQDVIRCGRGGIGMNRIVQASHGAQTPGKWNGRSIKSGWFHRTLQPSYPHFSVGVGDQPVLGGFNQGSFEFFDPRYARPRAAAWQIVVPLWAMLAAFSVLPALWLFRRRRLARRARLGCCLCCGYDLCATPDRCPECGAVPAGAKA